MTSVQEAIEKTLLDATKVIEERIDNELDKLDHLDEDGIEQIRLKRLKQVSNPV
jgi:acetyl-CoA carboxylase alpha subunit